MEFLVIYDKETRNTIYTYEELYNNINNTEKFPSIICRDRFTIFQIFLYTIMNMINRTNFHLKERCEYIDFETNTIYKKIKNIDEIINAIKLGEWKVTMYTSGTTGKPKSVTHYGKNILKSIKVGHKYTDNVWGFAYNPTHMAGFQVFLQALLNKNKIVYLFELPFNIIPCIIKKEHITHISATPTFYRNILPYIKRPLDNVQRVTLGGEASDNILIKSLKARFPNAKVTNIYATTEFGTLLISHGENFVINDQMKELIRIDKNTGELLVHKSIIGQTNDLILDGEWYRTGDIVEYDEITGEIRFISRKDEMINVGGYKVNPHVVEKAILTVESRVKDVRVYPKRNPLVGNIVVADIVLNDGVKVDDNFEIDLYNKLSKVLQRWEIPRIINVVDDIPKTRTGKKKRI